jgi:AmmeMemoRadiSam system protein B/AmmeMemoRadiSam system protein A
MKKPSDTRSSSDLCPDEKPKLSAEQEQRIFQAAGRRVASVAEFLTPEQLEDVLTDVADLPVYGAFVSLKREGRLRSCCGYLGPSARLAEAVGQAAERSAREDPRFPPIAPQELDYLDMEVWLLWSPEEVEAKGEDRLQAVTIGKHGLQISRGSSRGLLLPGVAVEHNFDARMFLEQTCVKAGLPRNAWLDPSTKLMRFEGYAIRGRLSARKAKKAVTKEELTDRPAAVAGSFYPATSKEVKASLDRMLAQPASPQPWAAAMVPHAGWIYSGQLAARVWQRLQIPSQIIILCPKHRPGGAQWSVAHHRRWLFPGGSLDCDIEMAEKLSTAVDRLELDAAAHQQEHAIEVQLPILARLAPDARVTGIAIGAGNGFPTLSRFASQMAGVLKDMPQRPLLIISSDMNHFADDVENRILDRIALDAIETLDPVHVLQTVQLHRISMCGLYPCVIVMETLRQLGSLSRCELVGYATSAEASGTPQRVVGYAGMLFG